MTNKPKAIRRLKADLLHARLEAIYAHYNDRRWVSPDPLETVLEYDDPRDQEIVGLIASGLAFGGVGQILKSIRVVLERLGPPRTFLMQATTAEIAERFTTFRHRYTDGADLTALLVGTKRVLEEWGSLEACFAQGMNRSKDSYPLALAQFSQVIRTRGERINNYLLPDPTRGSACKRLHLYLRWMIRCDHVDPGCWSTVSPSVLMIPVDTHMHRIARSLGWSARNAADLKTSEEITKACRQFAPADPVRYDFALTRIGIRGDFDLAAFLEGKF